MLEGDTLFVFALPKPLFRGQSSGDASFIVLGPTTFGVCLVSLVNLSTDIKTDSDAARETLSKGI